MRVFPDKLAGSGQFECDPSYQFMCDPIESSKKRERETEKGQKRIVIRNLPIITF